MSSTLGAWWREGFRTAFFGRPRWSGLRVTPSTVAALVVVATLLGVAIQRFYLSGDATLDWAALQAGWLSTAVTVWVCWLVVPHGTDAPEPGGPPGAAALFALLAAQVLTVEAVIGVLFVPAYRSGLLSADRIGLAGVWAAYLAPLVWAVAVQSKLVWQTRRRRPGVRRVSVGLLVAVGVLGQWTQPPFWVPARVQAAAAPALPTVTQDLLERQAAVAVAQRQALEPRREGVVNVFAITFSPYADEDVFRRESAMVAGVMADRFGATGHTIELVNHPDTIGTLAWATPLNLKRTVERMAALMNRDDDILFIHLTSHGARNGILATQSWPLSFEALTPALLKGVLDDAGIRYRIISVSACYSGSWIAPLAGDDTLVMTAADADHTSYGCGRGSPLTFFGRAMFDEELRRTWSFADAHAAARIAIDRRERAAGKRDGYSNPQIRIGQAIGERLARLAAERAAASR